MVEFVSSCCKAVMPRTWGSVVFPTPDSLSCRCDWIPRGCRKHVRAAGSTSSEWEYDNIQLRGGGGRAVCALASELSKSAHLNVPRHNLQDYSLPACYALKQSHFKHLVSPIITNLLWSFAASLPGTWTYVSFLIILLNALNLKGMFIKRRPNLAVF